MNNDSSLSHSRWECKYHVVWLPKYRRKALYGELNYFHCSLWWFHTQSARGCL